MDQYANTEIIATLGEVALRAHVIEDLLRLHLFEAGRFAIRGIQERTEKEIQCIPLQDVIAEFRRMYPEHATLADAFDLHRRVRNKMFHAFCSDLGRDLLTPEDQDQIHAMLLDIATLQQQHLKPLQKLHENLLRGVMKDSFVKVFEKTNDLNTKTVAKSDLLKLVVKLKQTVT